MRRKAVRLIEIFIEAPIFRLCCTCRDDWPLERRWRQQCPGARRCKTFVLHCLVQCIHPAFNDVRWFSEVFLTLVYTKKIKRKIEWFENSKSISFWMFLYREEKHPSSRCTSRRVVKCPQPCRLDARRRRTSVRHSANSFGHAAVYWHHTSKAPPWASLQQAQHTVTAVPPLALTTPPVQTCVVRLCFLSRCLSWSSAWCANILASIINLLRNNNGYTHESIKF